MTLYELYTAYRSGDDVANEIIAGLRMKVRTKSLRDAFRDMDDWRAESDYIVTWFVATKLKRLAFDSEAALVTYARTTVSAMLYRARRNKSIHCELSLDVDDLGTNYVDPGPVGEGAHELIEHHGRTALEREILTLVAQSYTHREIAERLGISTKSVFTKLKAIRERALKEEANDNE
jgi:hypothetical protein